MQSNPSSVSNHQSKQFANIEKSIREISPDVLVSPYLVQAGTDSKHYQEVSEEIYRFLMVRLTPDTLNSIHGINEKISIEDYVNSIKFYHRLLERTSFN